MRAISTLIVETNSETESKIKSVLDDSRQFKIISTIKDQNILFEEIRRRDPELIILSKDFNFRGTDSFNICRQIVAEFPSTLVIMVSLLEEVNDMREAMKAGARDFISEPYFETRLVSSSVELVASIRKYDFAKGDKNGKVITVFSPKGGSGKSLISLNLSRELSESSKDVKVALFDFDLEFGDLYFLSNVQPQRTLSDLQEIGSVDSDALEGHLTSHPNFNFKILPSPKSPKFAGYVTESTLKQSIEYAKKLYDYIIIDVPSGFQQATLVAIENSDLICLVTTGDLVSVKNTKLTLDMLELLDENDMKEKVKFVLNKTDRNTIIDSNELSKRFNLGVLGSIPKNDSVVMQSVNSQKTIYEQAPNSDVSKAFKALSQNILVHFGVKGSNEKKVVQKEKTTNKKGFLSVLFGK